MPPAANRDAPLLSTRRAEAGKVFEEQTERRGATVNSSDAAQFMRGYGRASDLRRSEQISLESLSYRAPLTLLARGISDKLDAMIETIAGHPRFAVPHRALCADTPGRKR